MQGDKHRAKLNSTIYTPYTVQGMLSDFYAVELQITVIYYYNGNLEC